jgi:hypothetical protein
VPRAWKAQYWDGATWVDVKATEPYTTAIDRMNTTAFEPIATERLRLLIQGQPDYAGGILEWEVY